MFAFYEASNIELELFSDPIITEKTKTLKPKATTAKQDLSENPSLAPRPPLWHQGHAEVNLKSKKSENPKKISWIGPGKFIEPFINEILPEKSVGGH